MMTERKELGRRGYWVAKKKKGVCGGCKTKRMRWELAARSKSMTARDVIYQQSYQIGQTDHYGCANHRVYTQFQQKCFPATCVLFLLRKKRIQEFKKIQV